MRRAPARNDSLARASRPLSELRLGGLFGCQVAAHGVQPVARVDWNSAVDVTGPMATRCRSNKVSGVKRHVPVDTTGTVLKACVSLAYSGDRDGAMMLLARVKAYGGFCG